MEEEDNNQVLRSDKRYMVNKQYNEYGECEGEFYTDLLTGNVFVEKPDNIEDVITEDQIWEEKEEDGIFYKINKFTNEHQHLNPEELEEYRQILSNKDAIVESDIINTVITYIKKGGTAKEVIKYLSENYRGFVPLINLFLKWLSASTHESKEILYKDIYKLISTYIKPNTEYSNTLPLYLYELVSQPQYLPLKYEICKSFPHSLLKELSIATQIVNDPYHCIGKWNVMEFDVNKEFIIQLILRYLNTGSHLSDIINYGEQSHYKLIYLYHFIKYILVKYTDLNEIHKVRLHHIIDILYKITFEKDTSVIYYLNQKLLLDNPDLYFKISTYLASTELNPTVNESITYCYKYYLENQNNTQLLFDSIFNSLFYNKTLYYLFTNICNNIPSEIKRYLIGLLKLIIFKNSTVDESFQDSIEKCLKICNKNPITPVILQKEELKELKIYSLSNITIASGILEWIKYIWSGKDYTFEFFYNTDLPPYLLSLTKEIYNKYSILINKVIEMFLYIINDTDAADGYINTVIKLLIDLIEKGFALDILSYFTDRNLSVLPKHLEMFETLFLRIKPPYSINFMNTTIRFIKQNPEMITTMKSTKSEFKVRIMLFVEECEEHQEELDFEVTQYINDIIYLWVNN